jgi:hypothetical protein
MKTLYTFSRSMIGILATACACCQVTRVESVASGNLSKIISTVASMMMQVCRFVGGLLLANIYLCGLIEFCKLYGASKHIKRSII